MTSLLHVKLSGQGQVAGGGRLDQTHDSAVSYRITIHCHDKEMEIRIYKPG
jgi:hypothetical protein